MILQALMALPYGRFPKYAKKRRDSAPSRTNVRIRFHGRHDLEHLSLQLQKVIARLQEQGVYAVDSCALYLTPLDRQGDRIALRDAKGKTVENIEVALAASVRFSKAAVR